jgi:hypothetical protein
MPSARFRPNPASTCAAYAPALSPDKTMCCVSFVLRPANSSNCHSKLNVAPSSCISTTKDLPGLRSRMCQCNGSRPGSRVAPREPFSNGPSNTNLAGGSFHVATSVRYRQAKTRPTSASTECFNSQAFSHFPKENRIPWKISLFLPQPSMSPVWRPCAADAAESARDATPTRGSSARRSGCQRRQALIPPQHIE